MIPELNGDFLQWLRGFYYVAKTGSVRKAAELMHRNPSTISYQIKSLEEELGTVLFDRYKKSLLITQEGKKLLGWTISTFETLQSMRSAVGTQDGRLQGEVCIGSTLPVAVLAAQVIGRFLQEHPQVHLRLERELSSEVVRGVKESRYDFGLTGSPPCPSSTISTFSSRPGPCLSCAGTMTGFCHPCPRKRIWHDCPSSSSSQIYAPLYTAARKFQKNVVLSVNNHHLVIQFVRSGLGVGIMDALCYRATIFGADWSTITCYPLDHLMPNVLYGVLTRRHKYVSPQAQALMNVLREHFLRLGSRPLDNMEEM